MPMPEQGVNADLLSQLRDVVGDGGVLAGDDVAGRSCDPFRQVTIEGGVILRPADTAQLSRVMALCSEFCQRVVVHGGRTGVCGGAYAGPRDLVVSLERMSQIREISTVSQLAVVEAGVTVQALQEAAADQDLFYPIDLGSKGTATIGGTIATNAGGNRVLRWGMTRQNLLGVEVVLADGTVVSNMNRLVKNNMGYDLKQLFTGCEGTLGIVTAAVLRLVPKPVSQNVAFVAVESHEKLLVLLNRARRLPTLSAFEVMWPDYYNLVVNSGTGRDPIPSGSAAYVLIETMGYSQKYDDQIFEEFLIDAHEDGVVVDVVIATSGKQIEDLWRVRESAEIIVQELSPFVSFDISLEVADIESFLHLNLKELESRYPQTRTASFGHIGDNNIHLAVHVGPHTLREERAIEACVFSTLRQFNGAITAEHGIGQFKKEFLPQHKSAQEMTVMHTIRKALDPQGLLNPDVLL